MSFGRKDFHNSRTYEDDVPPTAGLSLIGWLKYQLERLLRSGTPSSPPGSAVRLDRAPYSLLGVRAEPWGPAAKPPGRAIDR